MSSHDSEQEQGDEAHGIHNPQFPVRTSRLPLVHYSSTPPLHHSCRWRCSGAERPVRYLLTGGGTGGHVYPALAVAEALRQRDPEAEFLYVGARGGAEARLVKREGYRLTLLRVRGFPQRVTSWRTGLFLVSLAVAFLRAMGILLHYRPRAVFGTGGYAAAPVMLACWLLRRLRLIGASLYAHESNARPGRLNLLVARLADIMFTSHPGSQNYLPEGKVRLVGYPVRAGALGPDRGKARAELELPGDAEVLFVLGGSQGARTINDATVEALPRFLERGRLYVLHAVGPDRPGVYEPMEDVRKALDRSGFSKEQLARYRPVEYAWKVGSFYAASDLVVCRGGAGTLAETAAAGRPTVVVPKSRLPGDHQVRNALEVEASGAGVVLYETHQPGAREEVEGGELAAVVAALLDSPERLHTMGERARAGYRPEAARVMADAMADGPVLPDTGDRRAPTWVEQVAALSPPALADAVRQRIAAGRAPMEVFSSRELSYLRHKTLEYLCSTRWQVRNAGVKLAGSLQVSDTADTLTRFLTAGVEKRWWKRLAQGPYQEVGFVRRNSATALSQIGVWCAEVRNALLSGLRDPYFEVRSACARALGRLVLPAEPDSEVEIALRRLLADRCFEVAREAALALGHVGRDPASVAQVTVLLEHPNWKVRDGALRALGRMVERGVVGPELVDRQLKRLLVTSTDFRAIFPLKQSLHRLQHIITDSLNRTDGLNRTPRPGSGQGDAEGAESTGTS
jgi:UDP-N-acetylglucosamine--N-acetylmuramyl-(pentapeptide) pyrophosphoryl-undecaprenol N-acetylglucosamine transferase